MAATGGTGDATGALIPDVLGTDPILGWREWYVQYADPIHGGVLVPRSLLSIVDRLPWPARERFEARCESGATTRVLLGEPHTAPHPACKCGIYATRELGDLAARMSGADTLVVHGRVSLWGRVYQFQRGYRAQYAYPYDLTIERPRETRDDDALLLGIAAELGARYGVEARVR